MPNLIQRGAILTVSRLANYAVLLISPIFLVRILDVEAFGKYREFVLYATLFGAAFRLGAYQGIFYFVPKAEFEAPKIVSNSIVLAFAFSLVGVAIFSFFHAQLVNIFTFDFVTALTIYVFLMNNLDYLETYWLSVKRSDLVLFYTAGKLITRVFVVVLVAYISEDVNTIINSLIAVELAKCVFAFFIGIRSGLLDYRVDRRLWRKQSRYSMPLGLSQLLGGRVTREIGKFFVVTRLGAEALALYAVATYATPIVGAIRSSVVDVIFPEMVSVKSDRPGLIINIWKRATLLTCLILVPAAVALIFFANDILRILFSETFVAATLIFQIYCLTIVRDCFEFESVLRAFNKADQILITNFITTVMTVTLLFVFAWSFEDPAIVTVVAAFVHLGLNWYFASKATMLSISETAPLRAAMELIVISVLAVPVLYISVVVDWYIALEILVFSALYFSVVLAIAKIAGCAVLKECVASLMKLPSKVTERSQ